MTRIRIQVLALVALSSTLTYAQQDNKKGYLTGSFETNTIYYKDDSKTKAESPEDHFGSNNYLKLDYYQGNALFGRFLIFLQLAGILLAVEVEDHVIHLLANNGIVGQHLVTEACGGVIRQFLPHTLEKGFGIGKLMCIAVGIGDAAHQRLVLRHVLPLDIQIIGREVAVIISGGRIAAQAVAVMLSFHDVAIVLYIAAVDFAAVVIAETLHCEAAFQHTLPQRVHDLLQLRFERGAVQLLRAAGPPCMPELVAAAPEVHADMANGTQPLIFFGVRGIK